MTRADGTLFVRSRYYAVWGGPVPLGFGTAAIVAVVTDPEIRADPFGTGVVATLCAAVAIALSVRCWRVALIEVGDALLLRNVFTTRRVAWSQVTEIGVKTIPGHGYSAALGFRARDRRWRLAASATTTYSRRHAAAVCDAVSARAAAHGVPFVADPEELQSTVL